MSGFLQFSLVEDLENESSILLEGEIVFLGDSFCRRVKESAQISYPEPQDHFHLENY